MVLLPFVAFAVPTEGSGRLGGTLELDQAWFSAIDRLQDADYDTAFLHLEKVVLWRQRLGTPNFFAMSDVILREAVEASADGLAGQANRLLEYANELAPENPRVPLVRIEVISALEGAYGGFFGDVHASISRQLSHLPDRAVLTGRLAGVGLLVVLLSTVLFGVVMLFRHGRRLLHDVGHFFPSSFRGKPFAVLGALGLLVAPLSVGVGLVLMSLLWMALLFAYLSPGERFSGVVLALLVAATPILNGQLQASLAAANSVENAVFHCVHGRCSSLYRGRLLEELSRENPAPDVRFAWGLQIKREAVLAGRGSYPLNAAVLALNRAVEQDERSYSAVVELANAKYARENLSCLVSGEDVSRPHLREVDALYRAAADLSDAPVEAHFNRSVLLQQLGEKEDSRAARKEARLMDAERVQEAEAREESEAAEGCPRVFNANTRLLSVLPSGPALLDRAWGRGVVGDAALRVPCAYLLAGIVDTDFLRLFGVIVALVLLVGGGLARVLRPAHSCRVCQELACARCRRELAHIDLCAECLFIQIKGAFVDAREKWLRDRRVQAIQHRSQLGYRVVTLFLPGMGQLLLGRTVSGLFLLWAFLAGVLLVTVGPGLVPDIGIVGAVGLPLGGIAAVVACVAYIIAAVDAFWSGH